MGDGKSEITEMHLTVAVKTARHNESSDKVLIEMQFL
jgi:hypothetical protein